MQERSREGHRLRVMAEYGSSGIWIVQNNGMFRHSMVEHSALNMPPKLSKKISHWIEGYEQKLLLDFAFDTDGFNAEGRQIARELFDFMNGKSEVEFVPEDASGGLGMPELVLSERP